MIGDWHHHVVRQSVHLSVTLCIGALWLSGSVYRAKRLYQRVPSSQVLVCPFRHFCCNMYVLATQKIHQKRIKQREREFLRLTIRRALVVLRSVIHGLRELLNFGLSLSMITLE